MTGLNLILTIFKVQPGSVRCQTDFFKKLDGYRKKQKKNTFTFLFLKFLSDFILCW